MRSTRRIAVGAALCVFACGSSGRSPDAGRVREWIEAQRSLSSLHDRLDGRHVTYRQEQFARLTADELAALRRRVAGKPNHPEQGTLQIEERRAAGPEVSEWSVWWSGPGAWRINKTNVGNKELTPYVDRVSAGEVCWQFAGGQLVKIDAAKGYPPGYGLRAAGESDVLGTIGALMTGGLSHFDPDRWRVESCEVDGVGDWKAVFRRDGASVTMKGSSSVDWVRVNSWQGKTGDGYTAKETFTDWGKRDGLWIAGTMSSEEASRVTRRVTLERLEALDTGEFRRLCEVPETGRADASRGVVEVASVLDFTGGGPYPRLVGMGDGDTGGAAGAASKLSPFQRSGLVLAGFLALGLVCLKIIQVRQRGKR